MFKKAANRQTFSGLRNHKETACILFTFVSNEVFIAHTRMLFTTNKQDFMVGSDGQAPLKQPHIVIYPYFHKETLVVPALSG